MDNERGGINILIKQVTKLLLIVMILAISNIATIPIYAKDTITISKNIYNYPPNSPTEQFRFITVVKDSAWTKLETVEGQPTKDTYLKKGDSLFYGASGGKSIGISFGISLGVAYGNVGANVSFSVPLGKVSNSYYGKALKADKAGYYIIKAKKNIKPTIMFKQSRYKKVDGKWGDWEKPILFSQSYEVIQEYSILVKQ